MRKKILIAILMCASLGLLSGCQQTNATEISDDDVEVAEEEQEDVEYKDIDDREMESLFRRFLDIDEELILTLNQKPKDINDNYLEAYTNYERETMSILDKYLSDDIKRDLQNQYLQDEFNFFRFIQMNDHLITDIDNVDDAYIVSKEVKEDSVVYEVEVVAVANTIDYDWSRSKYIWSDQKGYYIKNIALDPETNPGVELGSGLDQIKVALNYYVDVPKDDNFTISSIKEKEGIHMAMEEGKKIKNNGFARRLPFTTDVLSKHQQKISTFLDIFMKQDYDFYNYYRIAHDTNYETLKITLEHDLGLANFISINERTYKADYDTELIPLKDNMESVDFDTLEDVTVLPHISSSDKISAYEVILETEVTLLNQEKVAYEYSYLFTLESGIISSIRALAQNELEII